MWGICFDIRAWQDGLFQAVVQYEIDKDNEAVIILPKANYKLDIKELRELPTPPKYIYGERVSPCNHPDVTAVIIAINWHFKLNRCFYKIKVNGKIKSKRYFDDDLISVL